MMDYLILGIFVFGLNIIPVFAPPTWMVLAFYFLKFHLNVIPVILIGATAAVLGRTVLYFLAKSEFKLLLPLKSRENLSDLGKYIQSREHLTLSMIAVYAFFPLPSNQTFIAAGLADISIKLIAFSFFVGRLISYSFWITASHKIIDSLEGMFERHYANTANIIVQIIGFLVIYFISTIHWKSFLKKK